MPLLRNDDLVRIDLPVEGEWVEVKRRLSRGDEITVRKAVVRGAMVNGITLESIDPVAAIEAAEFATLEVAVKGWSFEVPVTPDAIRTLDGESVDAIKVVLNELYPGPRTDDERKNSSGSGAAPSSDAEPSLPILAGSR